MIILELLDAFNAVANTSMKGKTTVAFNSVTMTASSSFNGTQMEMILSGNRLGNGVYWMNIGVEVPAFSQSSVSLEEY